MLITIIILVLSAIFFVNGKIRSDLVALCALVALLIFQILTPDEALSGFSNSVVIMMIGLFVVGGAIFQTGLAKMISSRILKLAGNSEIRLFFLVMLVTSADKNSAYYNETDPKAGHLWGDAAAAFFISKERIGEGDAEIVEVYTQGLGHLSKAMEAVHLRPRDGGILMPEGRDVFIQACTYMPKNVLHLLEKNGYTLDNLTYFIGHQANMRIMANIAKQLNLPDEKFLHNIEELGNTGSVSSALVYAQNDKNFKKDDLIAITVFGGGYSTGACLIKH